MFNHWRHISFIMISTTIQLWSWFNIIGGPRRRSVGISGGETATTARESAVCSNDDGTLNFRIRLFSHYSIFGVTNLLLCSPTSPSGVLCTNSVKTQLQHVKNCLVQLFKNTGCSPPLTSSVAVCHVSASPRPIFPPHHRLHGSAARLYPTDIRALQLFSGETTGILQTRAASWRWESELVKQEEFGWEEELNKVTPRTSACLQTTWCCWCC